MSRFLMSGLTAAFAVSALASTSAWAQSVADRDMGDLKHACHVTLRDCSGLDDPSDELDRCLLHNGRIQHACNEIKRREAMTGKGPKYEDAERHGRHAGHADTMESDTPAGEKGKDDQ